MNSVKLTGRLVTKPKLAPTDKGRPVCDARLLVDNGPYPAFEIDVSVFDETARRCAASLSKGDRVRVDGELRFRKWRDRAGRWHEGYSVIGNVQPFDRTSGQDTAPANQPDSVPVDAAESAPIPA